MTPAIALELESFSFASALFGHPTVTVAPDAPHTMDKPLTLDELSDGMPATVSALHAPTGSPEWRRQLHDLGFLPGEAVQVMRRAALGGDPLVVRVGSSTYALRRAEARCVHVHATPRVDGKRVA